MGVCSVCASLKSMTKSGTTDEEIKNYKNLLKEHRESPKLRTIDKKHFNHQKGTCAWL